MLGVPKMLDVKVLVVCCVVLTCKETQAKPFLTNTFQSLASSLLPTSASSDNIEDLRRPAKIQQLPKYQTELLEDGQNEAVPNIFQKKIGALLRKVQLITEFGRQFIPNGGSGGEQPKDPDFDFGFEEEGGFDEGDNSTEINTLVLKIDEPEAQKDALMSEKTKIFSPGVFGVYLVELVGSVVGLIYGAAIQFINPNTTKTNQ